MTEKINPITVPASKTGHEFHETWAARVALGLLIPNTSLTAIAIEGFSIEYDTGLSPEAMEIADLVTYFNGYPAAKAEKIVVAQFKYTATENNTDLSASDLAKTIKKFVQTEKDHQKKYGVEWTDEHLFFEFIANRPVGANLEAALKSFFDKDGIELKGHINTQIQTLKRSINLDKTKTKKFLTRFKISGNGSSLQGEKAEVFNITANWTGASDILAKFRHKNIVQLLRDKSGVLGYRDNVVRQLDVLGALEISNVEELYPVEHSFPNVSFVLKRNFFEELLQQIKNEPKPFLVHGSGGSGKTVIIQSLANELAKQNVVIIFDGFGGGQWRVPGDDRHLCQRGLLHLINLLAGKGLCDLILPGSDEATTFRTALKRLEQAATALNNSNIGSKIYLLLDAIDHAGLQADVTHTNSFARQLIFALNENPIEGLKLIVSCRTENRDIATGKISLFEFIIPAFSKNEIETIVGSYDDSISSDELTAIIQRSGGNPRCIDTILKEGRPFEVTLMPGEENQNTDIILDSLIEKRFENALKTSIQRGSSEEKLTNLLAGIAILPPPIPIDELAGAYGVLASEVESLLSDLFPLIELSHNGIVFRDEPTETFVRNKIKYDQNAIINVISRLKIRQSISNYAARSLPYILFEHQKIEDLIELAFSKTMPENSKSSVAMRRIRSSRIEVAITACTKNNLKDDLFKLIMEAAQVAGGSGRSDQLLQEFPDLVAISNDAEAFTKLVDNKSCWPGAHHGSLAMAYSFADDPNEARRQSNKAIEWLNWDISQISKDKKFGSSSNSDWLFPIFVLLQNGELSKILSWLGNKSPDKAFRFFLELLQHLNRHAIQYPQTDVLKKELAQTFMALETKPFWAIPAIINLIDFSREQKKTLIATLANCLEEFPDDDIAWHLRESTRLKDALIGIVIDAIRLGRKSDAAQIIEKSGIKRPRQYAYSDQFMYGKRIEWWIVASAAGCILDRRKPSIIDILPSEIWSCLSSYTISRGPKFVETKVRNLLNFSGGNKKKNPLKGENLTELRQVLEKRGKPLIKVIEICRDLILSKYDGNDFQSIFDLIGRETDNASNYPFREQKRYISRHFYYPIFKTFITVGSWNRDDIVTGVKLLKDSPFYSYSSLIKLINQLGFSEKSSEAQLILANFAADKLKKEDHISTRIEHLANLARAVWPVSVHEAGGYFTEALDLSDSIGSDNNEEIDWLVNIAARYKGKELTPETVHNFTRLCELNFPEESEKFTWISFGKALSRIAGLAGMAFIARISDREKIELKWAFPQLLAALSKDGKLKPKIAASICGLTQLREPWNWDISQFVSPVMAKLEPNERKIFSDWINIEIDRCYTNNVPEETLISLIELYEKFPETGDAKDWLQSILTVKEKQNSKNNGISKIKYDLTISKPNSHTTSFQDEDELDRNLQDGLDKESDGDFRIRTQLQAIAGQISSLDGALKFIDILVKAELPNLSNKLDSLEILKENWIGQSIAFKKKIDGLALTLTHKHANELLGASWRIDSTLRSLINLGNVDAADIIMSSLKVNRGILSSMSGEDWLRSAYWIASGVSSGALGDGLTRFITNASKEFPESVSDPVWDSSFKVSDNKNLNVATLIWSQLGSPYAESRWRAVHAVIRLAEFHKFEIISELMGLFETQNASPFIDSSLPFYYLHARLWLLIALARISKEKPSEIAKNALFFMQALDIHKKHVLIRHFSFESLSAIREDVNDPAILKKLDDEMKRSVPIGIIPYSGRPNRRDHYGGHPKGIERREDDFQFNYDFVKSTLNGLGRLFSVDTWKVEEDVANQVRIWDTEIEGMYNCPRGISSDPYGHDDDKFADQYGVYLANHAVWEIAGKYLSEKAIVEDPYSSDAWSDWMSDYTLSHSEVNWLSEGTDKFPVVLPSVNVDLSNPNEHTKLQDRIELAKLCGVNKGFSLPDKIIVEGWWKDQNGFDIKINSGLVPKNKTNDVSYALLLTDPFFQWLPTEAEDSDFNRFRPKDTVQAWLHSNNTTKEGIDETDPYGIRHALSRTVPNARTANEFCVETNDPFNSCWYDENGKLIFRATAWGKQNGSKRHINNIRGDFLKCEMETILGYLKSKKCNMIFLIKAQNYIKKEGHKGSFATKSAVIIITPNGKFRIVSRIPSALKGKIAQLDSYKKTSFEDCYREISSI